MTTLPPTYTWAFTVRSTAASMATIRHDRTAERRRCDHTASLRSPSCRHRPSRSREPAGHSWKGRGRSTPVLVVGASMCCQGAFQDRVSSSGRLRRVRWSPCRHRSSTGRSARVVVRSGSGEQVGDRDGFVAMRAPAADVDPAAGSLAVRAPLLAEVALLALGAGVDGGVAARAADRQGSDRGGRGGVAGSPRSLSAGR